MGERKAFYRQKVIEYNWARNKIVDIGILVTSRNGDRKTMLSIKIFHQPAMRMRNWNQFSQFRWTSRKYFSWLYFDNEISVQNRQWLKDQKPYIPVSVAYLIYPRSIRSPNMATAFYAKLYGRFITTSREKNFIEWIKSSISQHCKRWYFFNNRPISFFINSTKIVRLVEQTSCFSSIEINKPLPAQVYCA